MRRRSPANLPPSGRVRTGNRLRAGGLRRPPNTLGPPRRSAPIDRWASPRARGIPCSPPPFGSKRRDRSSFQRWKPDGWCPLEALASDGFAPIRFWDAISRLRAVARISTDVRRRKLGHLRLGSSLLNLSGPAPSPEVITGGRRVPCLRTRGRATMQGSRSQRSTTPKICSDLDSLGRNSSSTTVKVMSP